MHFKNLFIALLTGIILCCINSCSCTSLENLFSSSSLSVNKPITAQPEERTVNFNIKQKIYSNPGTRKIKLTVILPINVTNRQEVLSIQFNPKPYSIYEKNGNRYAYYENPSSYLEINIDSKLKLYNYSLQRAIKAPVKDRSGYFNKQYLFPEKYIESDHKDIQSVAQKLKTSDELKTIENIYNYVTQKMTYSGYNPMDAGALEAIRTGKGDCSEYTDLMVALARAAGIPARQAYGITTEVTNTPKHAWPEVYTEKYGWAPFDPTTGDAGDNEFDTMKTMYIYLSYLRTDQELNNFFYMCYFYEGSQIRVIDEYKTW